MLGNIHPKYTLKVQPKEGTRYNYVHDEVEGAVATVIDLTVGEHGWLAVYCDAGLWDRLRTSIIEDVSVDELGNISFTTRNTHYTLTKLS